MHLDGPFGQILGMEEDEGLESHGTTFLYTQCFASHCSWYACCKGTWVIGGCCCLVSGFLTGLGAGLQADGSIKVVVNFHTQKDVGKGARGGDGEGFSHGKKRLFPFGGPKHCRKWWNGGSQTYPRSPTLGFFSYKKGNQVVFFVHKNLQV